MIKPIKKTKWPLFIFIIMILISLVEEITIGEGGLHDYLQSVQHSKLRFLFRGIYAFIMFILGYKGLSCLSKKWPLKFWILWYLLAFLAVSLRIGLNTIFPGFFTENVWSFLSGIYNILLTPFPYLLLWMCSYLFKQETTHV